jgi:hypothetical protein
MPIIFASYFIHPAIEGDKAIVQIYYEAWLAKIDL